MKSLQNSLAYFRETSESSKWTESLKLADRDAALRKRAAIAKMVKSYYDLSTAGKAEFIRQMNNVNHSNYEVRIRTVNAAKDILRRIKPIEEADSACQMCGFIQPPHESEIEDEFE